MKNIKITKHAAQRRQWHPILDKELLKEMVLYFWNKFKLDELPNAKYKIYSGGRISIISITDTEIILITTRSCLNHFKDVDFKIRVCS